MKEILLTIEPTGEIRVETRGFTGKACLAESEFLKEVLGEELQRELTPAYFGVEQGKEVKKHLPLCG